MKNEMNQELKKLIDTMNVSLRPIILKKQFEIAPYTKDSKSKFSSKRSQQDIGYHLSYLAQAIDLKSPKLYMSYSTWLKGLILDLGFSITSVVESFNAMKIVLLDKFPIDYHEMITTYIDKGITELKKDYVPHTSFIDTSSTYGKDAESFLSFALEGNKPEASKLISALATKGVPIKTIYLEVLQTVQYEVGYLWYTNRISIAQEHYITSLIQLVISQLYPYIINKNHSNKTLLSAGVSGELHEIGLRMLTDIFEIEGWITWFLGTNLPDEEIINMINEKKPSVVALSVTTMFHLDKLSVLIQKIKDAGISIPIMVGGYPFNHDKTLWKKIGADGWAMNPDNAVKVADRLAKK